MAEGEGEQRFLPPEPSGPEPDLGEARPREEPPAPPPTWQQPAAYGPPQGYGQTWQPQPWQGQQPPPGWHGQAPWEQPPVAQQQPWVWQPQPSVPDNGPAIAGFSLSLTAGGLLVMSVGLSSVISIVCAVLGIVYSKRGRNRFERGETPKHGGLAKAGYIIGIVSLVLAVLATIGWALAFTDDQFWDDLEKEFDEESDGTETSIWPTALRAGALALRAAASLL